MKNTEEGLNHINMQEITIKHSDHRKQKYEPADEPEKTTQLNFCERKINTQSNYGL